MDVYTVHRILCTREEFKDMFSVRPLEHGRTDGRTLRKEVGVVFPQCCFLNFILFLFYVVYTV